MRAHGIGPSIGPSIGLIGARGHVGRELLRLVAGHPALTLAYASSRELAGQPVDVAGSGGSGGSAGAGGLRFEDLGPEACARRGADGVDVVVLALPNGLAAPYIDALTAARPETILVDLSADHRFDPAWVYGLPEHFRDRVRDARRISNPGCYATAMQLALRPLLPFAGGEPRCFGVSGHSGAGTTPSPRNDPERLSDNLLPYSLTGHVHEREVGHHLGAGVRFLPHVAAFFRGLSITVSLELAPGARREEIERAYAAAYGAEPLVTVTEQPPEIRDVAGTPRAHVGGLTVSADGRHLAVVCVLDNLLKGAASQALQNVNLALGLDELTGIAA
jgi:N-acetyl-gamma-glutamyl-phosphate reductase